jgi:hypothetical protein
MKFRIVALAIIAAVALVTVSCTTHSYHAYEAGEGYSEDGFPRPVGACLSWERQSSPNPL